MKKIFMVFGFLVSAVVCARAGNEFTVTVNGFECDDTRGVFSMSVTSPTVGAITAISFDIHVKDTDTGKTFLSKQYTAKLSEAFTSKPTKAQTMSAIKSYLQSIDFASVVKSEKQKYSVSSSDGLYSVVLTYP